VSGAPSCRCRHPLPLEPIASDAELPAALEAAARETVARLAATPGRPAAMAPFDRLLTEPARHDELVRDPRPVVGTLCNFVPEELVLAAGAIPIRLDYSLSSAARAGARGLAADVCPVVRALVGAQLGALPGFRVADLIVVPTSCDGKRKLVRALGDQREVHTLALPQEREGRRAQAAWREEIAALARRLEALTGHRIRRGALRDAIELLNRRSALARELAELRVKRPGTISGRDAFLVLQASFIADPTWWNERTRALLDELTTRPSTEPPALRLLLAGSPVLFPDLHLLELVEGSHAATAVIVADEMCSATERLYHPTVIDETTVPGILRAAADRTLLPCTCPCFIANDDRIDRILERARSSSAQGIIHHTLRLCQLFDLELPRVSAAVRESGLPMLSVTSEGSGEDSALLRNRIEAFLEMLQQVE
jgi:benzoyl-CoA reductase/2-hydroxyglutaryl-CoA dehydratase subunit BcrC/BadD/HgdB